MSTYVETFTGRCPGCGETNPGHVYCQPEADVYGWNCPACDHTAYPEKVEEVEQKTVIRIEDMTNSVEGLMFDCPNCDPEEHGYQPTPFLASEACHQCGTEFDVLVEFEEVEN